MYELFDATWRIYPATIIALAGAFIAALGVRGVLAAHRLATGDVKKPLAHMEAFRVAVIGLAVAAIGAAWVWQIAWLAWLALIIGGEETLESTLCVFGLTRGKDLRIRV